MTRHFCEELSDRRDQPLMGCRSAFQLSTMSRDITWRPRQDSNLRTRLRRPALYPLSYEGW
jgi:hypothetical protein